MLEFTRHDVGKDFHLVMRMKTETIAGLDAIFVDMAQRPKIGQVWIIISSNALDERSR